MPDIDINDLEGFDTLGSAERARVIATLRQKGYNISGIDSSAANALSARGGYNSGPVTPDLPALAPPMQVKKIPSWADRAADEGSSIIGDAVTGAIAGKSLPAAGLAAAGGMIGRGLLRGAADAAGIEDTTPHWSSKQNLANMIPGGSIKQPALRALAEGFPRFLASKMDGGDNVDASLNGMFAAAPGAAAGFAGFLKNKGAKWAGAHSDLIDKVKGMAGGEFDPSFPSSLRELTEAKPRLNLGAEEEFSGLAAKNDLARQGERKILEEQLEKYKQKQQGTLSLLETTKGTLEDARLKAGSQKLAEANLDLVTAKQLREEKARNLIVSKQQEIRALEQRAKDKGERVGAYQKIDLLKKDIDQIQKVTGVDPREAAIQTKIAGIETTYGQPTPREIQVAKRIQAVRETQPKAASQTKFENNEAARQAREASLLKQIREVDEIQTTTGFDPRKMSPDQWKAAEKIGKDNPEVYYHKVVDDLFSHDNYADLMDKGKKNFQSSIETMTKVSGLSRPDVRQGVRKAFMDRILGDVDTTAGILKNPDTLRYRLKAMGPDIVNQVFSNSSDPRREAGGAYDTFMELTKAASRETGTRKMRVFLTENGASIISLLPALGRVAGAPLGRDAENSVKGRLKDAGIAALAGGMTSLPTAPAVAAVAGPEVLSYTWQQLIEKAGNRNSKLGAAIRVLADTEGKYSSTAVQKAYDILRENASEKKQLNNDPNRTIRVAP